MDDLTWKAFRAGFDASAEGSNGECACLKPDEDLDGQLRARYEQWLVRQIGEPVSVITQAVRR